MNETTYNLFKIIMDLKSGCVFKETQVQFSTKGGTYITLVDADNKLHTICLWKNLNK